jgi:hypothetical protein
MSWVEIATAEHRTTFGPGQAIEGSVAWSLPEEPPTSAELRLFWYTEGKGDQDVGVVEVVPFAQPGPSDRRSFRVRAPATGPLSFEGTLITLRWALELIVEPGPHVARLELALIQGPTSIRLEAVDPPETAAAKKTARSFLDKVGVRST